MDTTTYSTNFMSKDKSNIEIKRLYEFINRHNKLVVLSGAGISAASGIPTYRDPDGNWLASKPITHQEFISQNRKRKRYWIRSLYGWPTIRDAIPNAGHYVITELEKKGKVSLLITQNVDRLHQKADSRRVLDLHGRVDRVRCLECNQIVERQHIQDWLIENNFVSDFDSIEKRPDGDVAIESTFDHWEFKVPDCNLCGGILKPDVVFFGGIIPKKRYEQARRALAKSDALLVTGSSLNVYSGYSFCRLANKIGKPIAIVNKGPTRADSMADIKLDSTCEKILDEILLHVDFS